MAIIDKIVLKDNNNVSTSYDISVKGENVSGTVASATTATKLTSDAGLTSSNGSATQPVYFSDGKPVPCTHTLGASVPANAKFTDTDTWRPLGTTADTACAGNDSRLSNARPASDVYSWAKASSKPSYTKAEVGLGNVDNTADSAKSVKYATSAGSAGSASTATLATRLGQNGGTSTGMIFNWNGQSGQPTWLWGGTDGTNMYVYNPSNFSVKYATSAGYADRAGSAPASDVYAWAKASKKPTYTYSEVGAAPASHTHSNYLTGINKSMVTTALGYTPPTADTNTWRGIANSLNSTDQSTSLSLYGGKLLNDKITAVDNKVLTGTGTAVTNSRVDSLAWFAINGILVVKGRVSMNASVAQYSPVARLAGTPVTGRYVYDKNGKRFYIDGSGYLCTYQSEGAPGGTSYDFQTIVWI